MLLKGRLAAWLYAGPSAAWRGLCAFREVFALLAEKRYLGALSYEAPNPAAWARDPTQVAQEALQATRAFLP